MRFIKITLKEGIFQKTVEFSRGSNIIYSKKNAVGKTTFLRAIYYALGYSIPSTKGIKFDNMEFWLIVESKGKQYKLYRHNSYMSIDDENGQIEYSLPTDLHDIQNRLTGCDNKNILDNMIGASYVDQEKGWTLLNRGKVIGNISFNIEALVRGLGKIDCDEELRQLDAVKHQQKKYEYMYSVAKYQDTIHEVGEDIIFDAPEEIINRRLEVLRSESESVLDELKQIKNILRKNKVFVEYISNMKLSVCSSTGEEIPVTRDTLVDFIDNNELLTTRREILIAELGDINRQIALIEKKREKEERLFNVQSAIAIFDSDIKKINIDMISTQRIIDHLKRERLKLANRIRYMTKKDNDVVWKLHKCISAYAKELDVSEKYVAPNKDYIFTNDLKSLSGTILHKIVFSFKLAYIKLIKEEYGIVLPIVLDSPSGREVKHTALESMLKIIQRDFLDHQLIVASIHDYDLKEKKIIEFKERLFSTTELLKIND